MPDIIKKIIIFFIIGGLAVSAYFMGYINFLKSVPRTTDEVVYYTMARQMDDNIFAYNTTGFALQDLLNEGKRYPEYFHRPLFKHPPLFTLMIVGAVKIFGPSSVAASLAGLMCWALAIMVVYLLGSAVGGRAVGLLAAGFMFMDPVTIMSSQKVWMDTPLMFFMLLTVYAYWMGVSRNKSWFFLLGGAAAGAAFLIKYPGLLSFFAIILFILLRFPKIFRNRYFLVSLFLPFLMALPWFTLNYYVYGTGFIYEQFAVHGMTNLFSPKVLFMLAVGLGIAFLGWRALRDPEGAVQRFDRLFSGRFVSYMKWAGFIGTAVFLIAYAGRSLNVFEVPWVTWRQGLFSGQPRWFYFQRLLRFCFLYGFSYLAFFDPFFKKDDGRFLLKLNAFLIIVFFAAWGNFQCRYILPALPFLMILSVDYAWRILGRLGRIDSVVLRLLLQSAVLVLIVLAVNKTMLINVVVSYTNNMCYF